MGKKRQRLKARSKSKRLEYSINTIIDFGSTPGATSSMAVLFGLMIAHDGNLPSEAFKAHPHMESKFDLVCDRLEGFEDQPNAIFVDLMIDGIADLPPVYAALVSGYFFALMLEDSPEIAEIFKRGVLARSEGLFDNRAS